MTGGIRPRRKGATYERTVVNWLRANGLPNVERRIPGMADDRGDITGWSGVVVDCKNAAALTLGPWMTQLAAEADRASARVAALIIKRRGTASVDDDYVVMRADCWLRLMRSARIGFPRDKGHRLPPDEEPFRALCWCRTKPVDVTPAMVRNLQTASCGAPDCRPGAA